MEVQMIMGSSISLETVQVMWEVETIRLRMTLNKIITPPLTHKFRAGFGDKIINRKN